MNNNKAYALTSIDVTLDTYLGTKRRFLSFSQANEFFEHTANKLDNGESATFTCNAFWKDHLSHKLIIDITRPFSDKRFLQHAIQTDIQRCLFHANNPKSQEDLEKLILFPSWQMEEMFQDSEEKQRLASILINAEGLSAPNYIINKTRFDYAIRNIKTAIPDIDTISKKSAEFLACVKSLPFRTDSYKKEVIQYAKRYFLKAISAAMSKDTAKVGKSIDDITGFIKMICNEECLDERQTFIGQRMYSMFLSDREVFSAYYTSPMKENLVMKFKGRMKHVTSSPIRKPTNDQWLYASIYSSRLRDEMTLPESVRSHKNISIKAVRDMLVLGKSNKEISRILNTTDPYSVNASGFVQDVIQEAKKS